jgi:hypothetical protein
VLCHHQGEEETQHVAAIAATPAHNEVRIWFQLQGVTFASQPISSSLPASALPNGSNQSCSSSSNAASAAEMTGTSTPSQRGSPTRAVVELLLLLLLLLFVMSTSSTDPSASMTNRSLQQHIQQVCHSHHK